MKTILLAGLVLVCGMLLGYGIFFLMNSKSGDGSMFDAGVYNGNGAFQNTHLITQPTTTTKPSTQFQTQSRTNKPTVID